MPEGFTGFFDRLEEGILAVTIKERTFQSTVSSELNSSVLGFTPYTHCYCHWNVSRYYFHTPFFPERVKRKLSLSVTTRKSFLHQFVRNIHPFYRLTCATFNTVSGPTWLVLYEECPLRLFHSYDPNMSGESLRCNIRIDSLSYGL